jgi:hypothetical protein
LPVYAVDICVTEDNRAEELETHINDSSTEDDYYVVLDELDVDGDLVAVADPNTTEHIEVSENQLITYFDIIIPGSNCAME